MRDAGRPARADAVGAETLQLAAVAESVSPRVVKCGLLGSPANVAAVAEVVASLDCALVLARAMDALGSRKAAYDTLDQRQFADDVRILGPEHPLSKDYEALRAELAPPAEPSAPAKP